MFIFQYFCNSANLWLLNAIKTDSGQPTLSHEILLSYLSTLASIWTQKIKYQLHQNHYTNFTKIPKDVNSWKCKCASFWCSVFSLLIICFSQKPLSKNKTIYQGLWALHTNNFVTSISPPPCKKNKCHEIVYWRYWPAISEYEEKNLKNGKNYTNI